MMGKIFGSKEMRLLMLGLDAAGKTSTIYPPFSSLPAGIWRHQGVWADMNGRQLSCISSSSIKT